MVYLRNGQRESCRRQFLRAEKPTQKAPFIFNALAPHDPDPCQGGLLHLESAPQHPVLVRAFRNCAQLNRNRPIWAQPQGNA